MQKQVKHIHDYPEQTSESVISHDLELFGLKIHNHTLQQAIDWSLARFESPQSAVFLNVNSINLASRQSALTTHINQADRVFADGSGVKIGAKFLGVDLKDNVNGTDLLLPLCEQAALKGRRIFLLGGKPGIATKASDTLCARFPALKISGCHSGYFDKDSAENDALIDTINASPTDILLVGFGSPIQEKWIADNLHRLNVSTVLAVGGLFDFFSGRIPRAPLWMRKRGIEWVWRLIQEPKAKFSRYVLGNPYYLVRLFLSKRSSHAIAHHETKTNRHGHFWSAFQRTTALMGLMVLSPLFLVCAALIKSSSQGPVFYSQIRVGKSGKRFKFYKFRSMYLPGDPRYVDPSNEQSDREGICKKYKVDPRVTSVGAFMRKYSIDELPQLVNVVMGDMLLIGPRPALVPEVDDYEHRMYQRFDVMPGLTGLWQVSGRADTTFDEQIDLDLQYVNQQSWWSDIKILFSTLPAVLLAKGAY